MTTIANRRYVSPVKPLPGSASPNRPSTEPAGRELCRTFSCGRMAPCVSRRKRSRRSGARELGDPDPLPGSIADERRGPRRRPRERPRRGGAQRRRPALPTGAGVRTSARSSTSSRLSRQTAAVTPRRGPHRRWAQPSRTRKDTRPSSPPIGRPFEPGLSAPVPVDSATMRMVPLPGTPRSSLPKRARERDPPRPRRGQAKRSGRSAPRRGGTGPPIGATRSVLGPA